MECFGCRCLRLQSYPGTGSTDRRFSKTHPAGLGRCRWDKLSAACFVRPIRRPGIALFDLQSLPGPGWLALQ